MKMENKITEEEVKEIVKRCKSGEVEITEVLK